MKNNYILLCITKVPHNAQLIEHKPNYKLIYNGKVYGDVATL